MTNHWVDIKNADAVLIMGSNCAENHPIAFKWIMEAKKNGAKIISVDPRFTRTSSKADIYAPIRSGTDIAFLGGMIRYAIEHGKYNTQYIEDCTNALFKVHTGYKGSRHADNLGDFSASSTWDYQYTTDWPSTPPTKQPLKAASLAAALSDSESVLYKLRDQYSVYTPDMVERICGTPRERFLEICEAYIGSTDPDAGTWQDNRAGTMLYAMGWTQHTVGTQNIRAATILQSLLGNMGVAGGGINALRGWHNVQGATDHGLLYHYLPGYNPAPKSKDAHVAIGEGSMDTSDTYLKATIPLRIDPVYGVAPDSGNWWGDWYGQYNRGRYVVSMLKAWWPTVTHTTSWSYLPKRGPDGGADDYSFLSLVKKIGSGASDIHGLFCWGTNPAMMGPDSLVERPALADLEWLVVCDLFETETSNFWKRPGVDPTTIGTTVYLLPGAAFFEKDGSVANSGRLAQWKDKACDPPGGAKDELEILDDLGDAIITAYGGSHAHPKDDGILDLNWPCESFLTGSLAQRVAQEINGYATTGFVRHAIYGVYVTYTQHQLIDNFFDLRSNAETACGNWLYCGTWGKDGKDRTGSTGGGQTPSSVGRNPVDYHPSQIGIYHKWGYAWPLNRRIIYNRASVYQSGSNMGKPLAGTAAGSKWVCWWDPTLPNTLPGASPATGNWGGGQSGSYVNDVVDGYGCTAPSARMPFIMNEEGVARLMGTVKPFGTALTDGPFPEHWEPMETPLTQNILTSGSGPLDSPYVSNWYSTLLATPGDTMYPIVCTTYRLSEHWHGGGMSRNLPGLAELMPEPFIEMSEELAAIKNIAPGDDVKVYSARNEPYPITVKACVTKRFKPFVIDGQTIHQVGLPWHWGYVSSLTTPCTGDSANILTPYIGDANTRIPEYKAFLVDIEKA